MRGADRGCRGGRRGVDRCGLGDVMQRSDQDPGSWVATRDGWHPVELWTRRGAERAEAAGWRVEAVGDYLARVNAAIRGAQQYCGR